MGNRMNPVSVDIDVEYDPETKVLSVGVYVKLFGMKILDKRFSYDFDNLRRR